MSKIPTVIEHAMFGYIQSYILFVGDELGVFDELCKTDEISLDELSKKLNLNPNSLKRLLIGAINIDIVRYKNGKFSICNEELKNFLRKDSPNYCGSRFHHYYKRVIKLFQYLKEGIIENAPQWKNMKDESYQGDLFDNMFSDKEKTRDFLDAMWELGYEDSKELCSKYNLGQFTKLIDVGGATGSFSIAALNINPNLSAIIFEREELEPFVKENSEKFHLLDRLGFKAGDFFKDDLPLGDVYSLGYIMSDWNTEQCIFLLKKVYQCLPPKGQVLILERLFNDDYSGPFATAMMNLSMLLEMYGEHRTIAEYFNLLNQAGFKNTKVVKSSGEKHMIIGIKE